MRVELERADGSRVPLTTDADGCVPLFQNFHAEHMKFRIVGKAKVDHGDV